MTDSTAYAAARSTQLRIRFAAPPPDSDVTSETCLAPFEAIRAFLSDRPLAKPNRTSPLRVLTNAELKRIAASNPPPAAWFEGEEERPF
jgi:hypothetical protein